MVVQTEDSTKEAGTQIFMPNSDDAIMASLAPPDFVPLQMPDFGPLPDYIEPKDEDEVDPEWIKFGAEHDLDPEYLRFLVNNDIPPDDWLRIPFGDGHDLPAHMLDIVPKDGEDWPDLPPQGWPDDAPWPPPKPKKHRPKIGVRMWPTGSADKGAEHDKDGDLPVNMIEFALENDLDPTLIQDMIKGNMTPEDYLRLLFPEGELPVHLLPPPGGDWQKERPEELPAHCPWPPPKPNSGDEVPIEWLQLAFNNGDDLDPEFLKMAMRGELDPEDWLRFVDVDLDPNWLNMTERPENYPADAPWPPPKRKVAKRDAKKGSKGGKGANDDIDVEPEWLQLAFDPDKDLSPEMLNNARHGNLDAFEWLNLLDTDINPEWVNLPDEDGNWPKERPIDYPSDAPWPPPRVRPTAAGGRRPSAAGGPKGKSGNQDDDIPPSWL
eukprot:Sspe_Gene.57825::Locus_31727_Transcript_1_1_Confidence_1.000_Length_1306::g.57825::m.57825